MLSGTNMLRGLGCANKKHFFKGFFKQVDDDDDDDDGL